jgi:phosphohistidine phosphatase
MDLILSSPYLRASETAVIAMESMHLKKDQLILTKHLAPLGGAEQLIAEINAQDSVENVLLVGHEPELGELVSLLLSGDQSISITLKKGGICCLSVDNLIVGKCATLEWLLNPAQLETL